MNQASNLIRLVVGIEVRPRQAKVRFVLDREQATRIGGHLADDLAGCVEAVTGGHLAIGPALLEPGQVLAPELRSPWQALARAARLDRPQAPGITSIGTHDGQLPDRMLGADPTPPAGQFLCLPLLLQVGPDRDEILAALERKLFDGGALKPPAMGELAAATGLDPIHGQLMTLTDLMALLKMQLAGAGLDPFWPPIEHVLLLPEQATKIELPGDIQARWNPERQMLTISLAINDNGDVAVDVPRLWWRAFRQQTALLDQHRIDWQVEATTPGLHIDPTMRWARVDRGVSDDADEVVPERDPELGLLSFHSNRGRRRYRYYPLRSEGIAELQSMLAEPDSGTRG